MRSIDRRNLAFWFGALAAVLGLKQLYGMAEMPQLQWLLQPLALLLAAVSDLSFQPLASGAWLDTRHDLIIVKACAGGNFLLASWLGYLWRFGNDMPLVRRVLLAGAAAWLTTLGANALRILLLVHGEDALAAKLALSGADSHRLIGIAVYFSGLCLQMVSRRALLPGLLAAGMLYLGITLLLPGLRAGLLGLPQINLRHALWIVGSTFVIALIALLLAASWRGLRQFISGRTA
jgi:exosortase K